MVQVAETKRKFPRFAAAAIEDVETSTLPWQTSSSAAAHVHESVEQLPEAGPSRSICADLRALNGKHRTLLLKNYASCLMHVLCCAVPCCAVPCCAVLCCAVLLDIYCSGPCCWSTSEHNKSLSRASVFLTAMEGRDDSVCAMHCCAGQQRMNSMGYLGMISVPIPRLRTESADADEVSLPSFPCCRPVVSLVL